MSTANNSFVLLPSLQDAINNDDIKTLELLLSTNPEILDFAAKTWQENPLTLAYKKRSFRIIAEIGSLKPEFVGQIIQDGYTVLHLACIWGDFEMVTALLRLNSQHCFVKDELSMIPLQTAAMRGDAANDVIRELISACPESIEKLTAQKETVFHLTAKNYRCDAFEVLFEEAKKIHKEHLLDKEDHQGNTVLHIAVFNQLLPIVKLLLPDYPSSARVNAKNNNGETPLDLYDKISDPEARLEIGRIMIDKVHLHEAIFLEQPPSYRNQRRLLLETKNVILVVLAVFIGLAFTVTCALPSFFPKESFVGIQMLFQLEDLIYGQLPLIFYIITFITIFLTTSTGVLTWLLYSLPCGTILILSGIATFILYVLLAYNYMPNFFVRVGSHYVSSSLMMWMLALGVIFVVCLLGKCLLILQYSYNFVIWWHKRKPVSKLYMSQSLTNKRMPRRNQSFGAHIQVGTTKLATASTSNN